MSIAVDMKDLVKVYPTGLKAVNGINLEIKEGEIFGLIGPNGAGKSTTIRMLCTLLKPTSGKIEIFGEDIVEGQMNIRKKISYLPEEAGAYENLSGREYLEFMANFYDGNTKEIIERGVGIASLGARIDSRIKEYSKGMKRRLLIARTLMTSPKLSILDEPTGGLDVLHGHFVRKKIREIIRDDGGTSIISSHNLLEVEFLCERVALINKGNILDIGTPAELKEKHSAENLEEVFLKVVRAAGGAPEDDDGSDDNLTGGE